MNEIADNPLVKLILQFQPILIVIWSVFWLICLLLFAYVYYAYLKRKK